jgi:hypothetical protein
VFVLLLTAAAAGFVLFIKANPPVSFEADVPSPGGPSYSSNRIADFQQIPASERTRRLARIVTHAGIPCTATDAIYKGKDGDGSAYYALTCSNQTSWMVTLFNNPEDSSLVTSCETMEKMGSDCFEVWQ